MQERNDCLDELQPGDIVQIVKIEDSSRYKSMKYLSYLFDIVTEVTKVIHKDGCKTLYNTNHSGAWLWCRDELILQDASQDISDCVDDDIFSKFLFGGI